jgi:hypothetical protein
MISLPDIAGLAGSGCILLGYGLLQAGRLGREHLSYSVLNALGAALILLSLVYSYNLPSVVIESAWLLISLAGMVRWFRSRA